MGDCVSTSKTNVKVEPQRDGRHRDRPSRDVGHRDQPERDVGHRDRPQRDVGHRDRPERDVGHRDRFGRDIGHRDRPEGQRRIGTPDENLLQRRRQDDAMGTIEEQVYNAFMNDENAVEMILKGAPLENIVNKYRQPPVVRDMGEIRDKTAVFLIKPFKYDPSQNNHQPKLADGGSAYVDRWDDNHVQMPCSKSYMSKDKQPVWSSISRGLTTLKRKCDRESATVEDLKDMIENYGECNNDMANLDNLINKIYSEDERNSFMYNTLSKMCDLVLEMQTIVTQPLPLLRIGSNQSVIMSQQQAASLLACAFFCLFPYRSDKSRNNAFDKYQNPNFERLYQTGSPEKIEKLKCILHYFQRVTDKMPTGVITIQRFQLPKNLFPQWSASRKTLCELHLTTGKKIEDIPNTLQVDFANKYIGGGVLGNGCVQEEIRFTICPEMLVSLIVCEMMETNECVFLIGCERYSLYKGYAGSFQFAGNYDDDTTRDSWGRRWCHVVAMDAILFRDKLIQYQMKNVERELLKAYTSFFPQGKGLNYEFGIATGNWGCGAFNGDRELKAIIQLMAASEVGRPLIYAAFGDKNLVNSFSDVYNNLMQQRATVGDLYCYLDRYADHHTESSLFEYILRKPVSSLRS